MKDDKESTFVGQLVWTPTSEDREINKFRRMINKKYGLSLENYWDLHRWSVEHVAEFWEEIWHYVGVIHSAPYEEVLDTSTKFEDVPQWFKGSRLNFAENLLRYNDDKVAFFVTDETRSDVDRITFAQIRQEVAVYSAGLKKLGVQKGDKVAGYLTSSVPAVATLLATTSLGAIWSAVTLEFGVFGVLDRLKQLHPKVLFASDCSYRDGKLTNYLKRLKSIIKELPTLEKVIVIPFRKEPLEDISEMPNSCLLSEFLASGRNPDGSVPQLEFMQVPFMHPVFVSYTSGTTGPPKGLVHPGGGVILQTLKELMVQNETRDSVVQAFSTVGWAAFNIILSHMAGGMSLLLYDGSPNCPKTRIFDLVDQMGTTTLWMYPYMLDRCEADGVVPRKTHKLHNLEQILVGASCPKPNNWDYIFRDVKPGIYATNITGATDVMGMFGGSNLTLPVKCGEVVCFSLGMAIECYNSSGQPVVGESGDLVITKPFPSMPLYLLQDDSRERYKKTYFSKFPGIWTQGDLIQINPVTGGFMALGRSDAVLNPKGRRFGSSEIYNVVDTFKEIEDSVCVAQYNKDGDERVVLFLKMRSGCSFSDDLVEDVRIKIKEGLTEKHCPSLILETKDIPYTVTGKKVELAVKMAIAGEDVPYRRSLDNPESLDLFYDIPQLQGF